MPLRPFIAASLLVGACTFSGGDDDPADDVADDVVDDIPVLPGGELGPAGDGTAACTVGNLWAGNPLYAGSEPPRPSGTLLLEDPPLEWRDVEHGGGRFFTHVGQELWGGERDTARRFAGDRQDGMAFGHGLCAEARLASTSGIAVLPDDSLVVADAAANALVRITDPLGDHCRVDYLAGTAAAYAEIPPGDPPGAGFVDGLGANARFSGPARPVADAHGNVYVIDQSGTAIRRIRRTGGLEGMVTTVPRARGMQAAWLDLAVRGEELVAVGGADQSWVVAIDPLSGTVSVLAHVPTDVRLQSVAVHGERVFVSGGGRIWEIAPGGAILVAGGYSLTELAQFPFEGYDPAATQDALELALPSEGHEQPNQFLTWTGDGLLFTAHVGARGHYVEAIACDE
jgi:hypothetical protein